MKITMNYPSTYQHSDYKCTVVIDIGLAQEQEKNCGLVVAKKSARGEIFPLEVSQEDFTQARRKIFDLLKFYGGDPSGFALVIEAPLSVQFENNSPKERSFIRSDMSTFSESSYRWYAPIGASVMAGAVILIKSLFMEATEAKHSDVPCSTINLFEAFSVNKGAVTEENAVTFIQANRVSYEESLSIMKGTGKRKVIHDWVDATYIMSALIKNGENLCHVRRPDKNSLGFVKSICEFFRLDDHKSSSEIPSVVYLKY